MNATDWSYQVRRAGRAAFMGLLGALALAPHPSVMQLAVGATFGLATMWYVDRASPPKGTAFANGAEALGITRPGGRKFIARDVSPGEAMVRR